MWFNECWFFSFTKNEKHYLLSQNKQLNTCLLCLCNCWLWIINQHNKIFISYLISHQPHHRLYCFNQNKTCYSYSLRPFSFMELTPLNKQEKTLLVVQCIVHWQAFVCKQDELDNVINLRNKTAINHMWDKLTIPSHRDKSIKKFTPFSLQLHTYPITY